jgi:hypothetical protein
VRVWRSVAREQGHALAGAHHGGCSTSAGLLTGGTAGLAFLLHYATGIGFGKIFFVLNLPFYWLALRKLGRAFTIKTFAAVLLLSVLTELQTQFLQFAHLQPLYAAIAGGLITGTGFLVLFRHRCSLGGVGILALYLQDRYGWRAGKVQMAVDCCIVLLALWSVEPLRVAWSIAGAVALNLVLAMNHRPGRTSVSRPGPPTGSALRRAPHDPHRLAAPFHGAHLARSQVADVHFHGAAGGAGALARRQTRHEGHRRGQHRGAARRAGGRQPAPPVGVVGLQGCGRRGQGGIHGGVL